MVENGHDMNTTIEMFSWFKDSRLQRLIEEEQATLICGLLYQILETYIQNELNIWDAERKACNAPRNLDTHLNEVR
jgi:hypothetical protein